MHKLLSILSIVLLYVTIAFGQGAINIPLVVSEATSQPMFVGLDLTATTCQDPLLGENLAPPFPPPGGFGVVLDLQPYGCTEFTTFNDYRNAPSFPFSGNIEYQLYWQRSASGTPINVQYTLPTGAVMRIRDLFGGIILNIGPFTGTGTAVIPGSYSINNALVIMEYTNIAPTVTSPIFAIAPASLIFGTVNVGSNATLPVTVSNTGTAPLDITGISSSNAQFTFAPGAPVTIPAGGNQVFNVTFAPTANGLQLATITFTHNAPGSPTLYSVQGTGYTPAPIFGVSPASLNFGSVAIGGSATLPVTVSNTGDAMLILSGISSSDPQFTFAPNVFPINVPAGGNTVFNVTYTPTVAGPVSANLTFTHNAAGSPTLYSVQGEGFTTEPFFGISPASLNFGQVSVGGSATLPVTVSNTGNAMLILSGVSSSDAHFTFAPNTFPINIAAGGSVVFNVTFTPTVAGPVSGNLTFTHNAVGSPFVLPVQGEGRTQGGELKFITHTRILFDGSTNNQDTIVLSGYTGQPLKSLQFDVIIGKINGLLILNSVTRGDGLLPATSWYFDYEVYPGPILPDGSHTDRIKVVILGAGDSEILPGGPDVQIMRFSYDVVPITGVSAITYNGLENVVGATSTPVVNANITAGPDEILTIYNGTTLGLLGDVNLDNYVDILDILTMIDYILGRITFNAQQMLQGDIAPWVIGEPLPFPDGVINVLDLAVLQNIVLTGLYPSGDPINKPVIIPPYLVSNMQKLTPGMDAKLTFYLTKNGITVSLESIKKVKGVQIELNGVGSSIPGETQMTSIFNQALYYQLNDLLRTLTYDAQALPLDAGEYLLLKIPFNLNTPQSIEIDKIIIADEFNTAMQKVEVEIRYEEEGLPVDYWISQNYPNPFNPSTTVQFSVPVDGLVTVKVYDMLGQEIASLFSGDAQRGIYTLNWDGKDLQGRSVTSGTYIYRMIAGEFTQSKKMTLLK